MLELVPISLKEANAYVERYHRHHKPVVGHKFSIAAAVDGEIVGVIADLAEVNRLLLEELENYRSMEDEDKQLLMMIEDIKEGHEDLERMLEP